jgi:hypothetical protein
MQGSTTIRKIDRYVDGTPREAKIDCKAVQCNVDDIDAGTLKVRAKLLVYIIDAGTTQPTKRHCRQALRTSLDLVQRPHRHRLQAERL